MAEYEIMCEELSRVLYSVEAASEDEARSKLDRGEVGSGLTVDAVIEDVLWVREAP